VDVQYAGLCSRGDNATWHSTLQNAISNGMREGWRQGYPSPVLKSRLPWKNKVTRSDRLTDRNGDSCNEAEVLSLDGISPCHPEGHIPLPFAIQ
jgi:hypothetical protein